MKMVFLSLDISSGYELVYHSMAREYFWSYITDDDDDATGLVLINENMKQLCSGL